MSQLAHQSLGYAPGTAARIHARHLGRAFADDVAEARGARMRFAQHVRRNGPDGDVICEGSAEVACMDVRRGRPRRLPEALMSELTQ